MNDRTIDSYSKKRYGFAQLSGIFEAHVLSSTLFAARGGHTETAKRLIEHKADVNATNKDGDPALI